MISLESVLKSKPVFKGAFVNGEWQMASRASGTWEMVSPANLDWVLPSVNFSFDHVDASVSAAAKAFPAWRDLPLAARIDALKNFGKCLEKYVDPIGRMIALETGKPLDEALGEAALLKAKIDVTIEYGLKLVETQVLQLGAAGRGEIHWRPKGVVVVIGPFNFPVHLNNGHIIPALLMGNTVILKPSQRTPYSAQLYMEAAKESGLPAGVLQMVQGDAEVATRLIRDTRVNAVAATCSFEVGAKIQKELAHEPEKLVALELGGKNAALVWDGSNVEQVAQDLIRSAYLTTGQRCTCLSRTYVKRDMMDALVKRFHTLAKELVISHPFDEDPKPFMGPLISAESKERFLRYSTIATGEDAESIMRPKALEGVPRQKDRPLPMGHYVTPSVHVVKKWDPKSHYQNDEIFGPDMFFCPVDSLEEGIAAVNSSKYGLAFSFFGADEKTFHHVADRIESGLTYYNRPTVGASARLPFGGWKRSGNHRPAGLFSIFASTQVQARILT